MTEEKEHKYRRALRSCFTRYLSMCGDDLKLLRFVDEALENSHKLDVCKLNRWLGYIQGTLIAQGKTTVEKERDWTRPYFKPLDDNVHGSVNIEKT